MEDQRFDSFTKSVANRASRRRLLAGMLGLGGGVAVTAVAGHSTEAARRGFAGPTFSLPTPPPICLEDGAPCSDSADCCSSCCVSGGGADFACVAREICK